MNTKPPSLNQDKPIETTGKYSMIIKPILSGVLETVLNQYLALDDKASLLLTDLAGKVIAVNILPFNQTLYFCPSTDRIQILEKHISKVNSSLSGTLSALGLMGTNSTSMHSIFSGEVSIEGDIQVAHNFQRLFEKLDINLEEKLSQFTGDIVAHKIANLFRSGQNWSAETIETFKLNSKEFLQEEIRHLPAEAEADIFYQQVAKIHSEVNYLATQITSLEKRLSH